ncbi:family 1 extracellular solute-binding protein [Natrialba magadii ATCC 43099]|uniref:Family 1 extracellular solute-binding protein n=1 Tax=Natrialba magadii (strain ATCC 43099 / DSM 3394 / CCM 3739 / CIP 104546 / IAM 13178 / JCM 8861 / NBRC 102185 / NCIMB 2190 / MS3) TaxID=547559 RepID=L9UWI3_NATMM|nr:extracellular solute-binding protein [Natrialba magadii]ELY29052.1 family 1 extracellular solute-binding protein [Natrialba magadii ATCC 43099]
MAAASATTAVGATTIAGCLGRGHDPDTVIMTGATDFEEILHTDGDEPDVQQALWDVGLDEDIRVEVQTVVSDSAQRMQEAQSTLQAGRAPPDIHMMDTGWTIPFILREQTTNLTEELPDDVVDRIEDVYLDEVLETARHPETDDIHGLPLFPDFGMMLYRQDLVEDAGHDTSDWATEPPSWETFSQAVADAQDEAGLNYGLTTQAAAFEGLACCTFNEVMSTWGGGYFGGTEDLFTAGDRPITVTDDSVLDAIRMMRAFIHGDDDEHALEGYPQICPSAIVQWTEEESLSPFEGGDAVANRNWPFAIAATGEDDAFGEDLGVITQPYAVSEDEAEFEGVGGTAAALGGWNLTVSPYTDQIDEVLQVLEAFTHDEVMLTIFELQGFLPPNIDLVEEADPDEIGPIARYVDQIQLAGENAVPRPVTDVWPEQSALIFQEVNAAYRGAKSPSEAMEDLAGRLEGSESEVAARHGE